MGEKNLCKGSHCIPINPNTVTQKRAVSFCSYRFLHITTPRHFKTELGREMQATMAMDVEARPSLDSNSAKRFGLKNSIQTNFGDDYIFQIIPKDDWSTMAVSLSTNTVKLYSPVASQYHGECMGHSDTINQILFSGLPNSHVIGSCSSDGTIRIWGSRTSQQVSCITAGPSQEVNLWDWRDNKQIACLEESHVDDVTQVHFVPNQPGKLVSASVDGLICTFDISGDINDDDHLESVSNAY